MNNQAMTIDEWRQHFFTEAARPPKQTIIKMIKSGEFPEVFGKTEKFGKKWVIIPNPEPFNTKTQKPEGYITLTGDEMIDNILKDGAQ